MADKMWNGGVDGSVTRQYSKIYSSTAHGSKRSSDHYSYQVEVSSASPLDFKLFLDEEQVELFYFHRFGWAPVVNQNYLN